MRYLYNQRLEAPKVSKVWLAILTFTYVVALAIGSTGLQARGGHGWWHDKPDKDKDSTIVISSDTAAGENQPGWMFNRDASTATPYEFTTAEASIGNGSLHVMPIGANPSDKFIGEYFYLDEIANVNSISYDFMTADTADAQQFYMNLYVNDGSNPSEFYDCRYNVVPAATAPDATTGFTTFTYDLSDTANSVTQSGSSSITPCPDVPADLPDGAVLRAVALNVGDTSASEEGLEGYLDNVVLSEIDKTTTFDFDPYAVSGEIKSPDTGELVGDKLKLKAKYDDGDNENDDAVQWAVRADSCAAGTNTVLGNVDGHDDEYEWNGKKFSAKFANHELEPGAYCFIFNPTDDAGQENVRETVEFYIGPQDRADCADDGWTLFGDNFDSERDCKKHVKKHSDNGHHGNNDRDNDRNHRHWSFIKSWWSWFFSWIRW